MDDGNQHSCVLVNLNGKEHVLLVDDNIEITLLVAPDENALCIYKATKLQSTESPDYLQKDCFCKFSSRIYLKPLGKKYSADLAWNFTAEKAEEANHKDSYETIRKREERQAEDEQNMKDQLELWSLCIEAEQKVLVDIPFDCNGAPEVKKKLVRFPLADTVDCDADDLIDQVREKLGKDNVETKKGKLVLSLASLRKIDEDDIQMSITSCNVTVECSWQDARKFKNYQNQKGVDMRYGQEEDGEVPLTMNNPQTVSKVCSWIDDVNANYDFYSRVEDNEVECTVSLIGKRKETKEQRAARVKALAGKEFKIGNTLIGTLIATKGDFNELWIKLPDDDKAKEAANKKIETLTKVTSYSIKPSLEKDLAILNREKSAIEKVSNGSDLANYNLPRFIFNSSYARATNDFEAMDIEDTPIYKECRDTALLNLNNSQQEAVVKGLCAQDLCLLQGPPGTGKTTVIAELLWQHIRKNQQSRIMLTSQTNLAIDNALSRLLGQFTSSRESGMWRYMTIIKPLRIADEDVIEDEGKPFSTERIDAWATNGKPEDADNIVFRWLDNIASRIDTDDSEYGDILTEWKQDLETPDSNMRKLFAETYKKNYNILGMTCGKVDSADFKQNKRGNGFDAVIMDEASKATPPELLMPLCYAQKAIVIGDHRQLPPMMYESEFREKLHSLQTDRAEELAKKLDPDMVETSLFKRLITNEDVPQSIKATFNVQYRMHPQIGDVVSQFYTADSGGLRCGLDNAKVNSDQLKDPQSRWHGFCLPGFIKPGIHTIWVDVPEGKEMQDGTSWYNQEEVNATECVLKCLVEADGFKEYLDFWNRCGDAQTKMTEAQVGIISFYGRQVQLLQSKTQSVRDKYGVACKTASVDRFQGQERGIVIVSAVRTRSKGFTSRPERLNVALSRARRLLVIVGNSGFYQTVKDRDGNYLYRPVIEKIKENGGFVQFDNLKHLCV